MEATVNEAIGLLTQSGVMDRLREEAQRDRERERDELLAKLADEEAKVAEAGPRLAEDIARVMQDVSSHEAALLSAKQRLNELTAGQNSRNRPGGTLN